MSNLVVYFFVLGKCLINPSKREFYDRGAGAPVETVKLTQASNRNPITITKCYFIFYIL